MPDHWNAFFLACFFLPGGRPGPPGPWGRSPRSTRVDGRVAQAGPHVRFQFLLEGRDLFGLFASEVVGFREVLRRSKSWAWRVSQ